MATILSSVVNLFGGKLDAEIISQESSFGERSIFIQKGKEEYRFEKHISILEDTNGKWEIADVSSDSLSTKFVRVDNEAPNYGFSNSVFWIRFDVIDTLNAEEDRPQNYNDRWLLINRYPMLEDIRLYYRDNSGIKFIENKAGLIALSKSKNNSNLEFVSRLPMRKNEINTFYIRVATPSPVIISFEIMSIDTFYNRSSDKQFFFGIMFGIFFLIIAYNTFLYFSIKEKTYLFYVLYVFSCASFLFIYEGYYNKFFGSLFVRDYYTIQTMSISCIGLFWLLLTRDFLQTKKYLPAVYKLLSRLVVVTAIIIVILFFLPLSTAVSIITINDIFYIKLCNFYNYNQKGI